MLLRTELILFVLGLVGQVKLPHSLFGFTKFPLFIVYFNLIMLLIFGIHDKYIKSVINTAKQLDDSLLSISISWPFLYMFTGAPSGGLQQNRDMFNWSNSALQMGPQINISSGRTMDGTDFVFQTYMNNQ